MYVELNPNTRSSNSPGDGRSPYPHLGGILFICQSQKFIIRMKILYAIQGTGNGHLSRAMDIVPLLQKRGYVNVLVSGVQGDLNLPFPVKYQFKGLSFIFGKKGGVDMYNTFL